MKEEEQEEIADCDKFMESLVAQYKIPKSQVFPATHAAYCNREIDLLLRTHRNGLIYGVTDSAMQDQIIGLVQKHSGKWKPRTITFKEAENRIITHPCPACTTNTPGPEKTLRIEKVKGLE